MRQRGGFNERFLLALYARFATQRLAFADGDRLDLQGQGFSVGAATDGSVVLTLSGGGSIALAGVTTF